MTNPHDSGEPRAVEVTPVDFDPFAPPEVASSTPLSEAQLEIWSATQMGPEASCAYNQCFALRLEGELSVEALRAAVLRWFDRHEALRITFDPSGERQLVQPVAPVEVPTLELTGLPPAERKSRIESLLVQETGTPFDLVNGPTARAQIVVEASDRCLLVLTAHHIICDGWAAAILFNELPELYDAARRGETHPLPSAGSLIQAMGRADVQSVGRAAGEEGPARETAALTFWKAQLADAGPALDLPLDHARPPVKTYRAAQEVRPLGTPLSTAVRRTAARQGTTLVGFLLAAFQTLLYRLTGQEDVIVGLPVSVRPPGPCQTVVGHLTNLLPVRVVIDGQAPFAELVRRTKTALFDAREHDSVTFGALVRELQLPRDPGRTPLVGTTFNVARGLLGTTFPNLRAEVITPAPSHLNFELEMDVQDGGGDLAVECAFNTDLFSPATVRRWLAHFEALLAHVVRDPQVPVDRIEILTGGQREVMASWNATSSSIPGACVHELISAQAGRTPKRVAVESVGQSLSHAELDRRSDALARRLRARGVKPGVRVGVFLERGLEMVVGVLAVLKAGAAYVPLDPAFPPDRLRYMVEDSQAAVLLTHAPVADDVPSESVPVVRVDEEDEDPGAVTDGPAAGLDDLAYVIYTSGSTGKPKGVAITHRNLVNFLESMRQQPGLEPGDVLLSVTTLSFDIATLELYLPLMTGARVVVASRDQAADGHQLLQLLGQATVMQATPATWRLLLESGWEASPNLKVLCGGEALPRELARELLARAAEVWNVYGPTETTVWSSLWRVEGDEGPISIGRPIANTEMHVLDPHMSSQPVGVPGELYIGGAGVAHGYWKRPELTAERFVPDPFSQEPGARLYRTGDLARWLGDGRLECLGRIDHQVKVRGFRIELGEIETALERHPAVAQAVVVVREDNPGDRRLVAYLVGDEADAHAADLRQHLAQTLPDYMVPSAFASLDSFPLTPNGKVDRKALLQESPPAGAGVSDSGHEPPRTDSERLLAGLWQELLGIDAVGRHDNFFDLGGHSILAHRMAAQVEERTRKRIAFREITIQTLESLAAGLDTSAPESHPADTKAPGFLGRVTGTLKGLRSGSRVTMQ